MTKKFYTTFLVLLLGCITAFAQNQTDSIQQSKQTQMTQDSLKKAQEKQTAPAQTTTSAKKDTRPLKQKISLSLSTGFWIDPNSLYFEISPMITYHFPKTYSIGTGPTYIFNKNLNTDGKLNGWGGKIYGQANFTRWLFGWTEYQGIANQHLTIETNPYKSTKDYEYVDSWFLSLGISLHLGRKTFTAQALYDVLYKESTAYTYSPWTYRIGFGF